MTDTSKFHDAMTNRHRRRILYAMAARDDQTKMSVHPRGDVIPEPDSQRLRSRLLHVHLPKLADYGYVEWEEGTFLVARGPNFDEIRSLLVALGEPVGELLED